MNPRTLICLATALLSGCGADASDVVRAQLSQAIQTNPQRIEIARYVTGDWDRFCAFAGPYPAEAIAAMLGFAYPEALDTGIETTRDESLLLFIKGQKVTQAAMMPKSQGYFGGQGFPCHPRDRAVFKVADQNVKYYRQLVPAQPVRQAEVLDAKEELEIMEAAIGYVKSMSGAYGVYIDPASHRAADLARAMRREVKSERDAYTCADATDAKSCVFPGGAVIVRTDAPRASGLLHWVNVDLIWPVKDQPWRTQTQSFDISLHRPYSNLWEVQQGANVPTIVR